MASKKPPTTPETEEFASSVDEGWELEQKVEALKSELKLLEDALKDKARSFVRGFGSVNLHGSEATAQIQFRHPSVSIPNGNLRKAEELLGKDLYLFFNVTTTGETCIRPERVDEVKELLLKAKKNPDEFFALERIAKAKDTWLEAEVSERLLGSKAKKLIPEVEALTTRKEAGIAVKWNPRKPS